MSNETSSNPIADHALKAYRVVSSGTFDEKAIIEEYLPVVRSVVERLKINLPPHVDENDLHSAGITGLIAAVKKYDPSDTRAFLAYARTRVRGAILDDLRRMDWCSRSARIKAKSIKKAIVSLEQSLGRAPNHDEIAEHLGLDEVEYNRWLDESRPLTFVSMDAEESGDVDEASLKETIRDESTVTGRETMELEELGGLLADKIDQLPVMAKKVIAMYYFEDMRLAEIAAVFGITESRVCQIHTQTILKLRGNMDRLRSKSEC